MSHASTTFAGPEIGLRLSWPKLRWPSQRTRAVLMIAAMISPAFLADQIGYCVQRLFMTADQIAVREEVPDTKMMERVDIFHVACVDANAGATEQEHWAEVAARNDWPRYPVAGPGCFRPDRNLYGIAGLTAFNVACPNMVLSVADHRRWVAFAANHGWTDYAQAGAGCVDP